MPLRVYSTLTRTKEDFQTVEPGKVRMYLCGPTVYKPAHIGHMVGPVIFDTIKRYLVYQGYDVQFVINITDVDDKLIVRAQEKGTTVKALAEQMTADYFDNLKLMGVDSIDKFPYATDHIGDMLEMIGTLIEKGHAYPLNGDVYFAVESDPDYGKLSNRSIAQMLAGTRVEANDKKRNPADFALWKSSKPGEPAWDSPWGPGRPGWHIECSAMSAKLLGDSIDIHGGGLDLMFPHHENELAQSECCSGKPFARYWLHNGLMQSGKQSGKVGGAHSRHGDAAPTEEDQIAGKLAGSAGAESVKTAVFAHHPPETVRFFLLSTHYRSPIDFSLENIAATGKSLEGFYRLFEEFERITGKSFYSLEAPVARSKTTNLGSVEAANAEAAKELAALRDRYVEAMDDDFNTGGAVAALFDMRRVLNGLIGPIIAAGGTATDAQKTAITAGVTLFKELSNTLGVFRTAPAKSAGADDALVDGLMQLILDIRADSRKNKNWAVADKIRDALKTLNVVVEDRPDGVRWSRG
ncbi:cysteine--tRNA ligase [Planctomyces sp. SCGC AG-212-M04]|nr:cysteine--tRNA ligase [Planctomyces sp. SCGC AG-212-M04]